VGGFKFLNPAVSRNKRKSEMNIFDKYYKKYDAWYDRNKFAYLSELRAIKKVLPKKGKGLEIGVGTGRFAAPLGIATGIDPSKNMIKVAKQRGIDVKLGNGEHLPFADGVFDYIVIIITLCFTRAPQKVLEESRRVLKRNGKVIIGIVDKDSFLGRFYQKKKSVFYKQAHFFSVEEVVDLLKVIGFDQFLYYQTLFKLSNKVDLIEKPQRGYSKGGFVVIRARKKNSRK